MLRCVVGSKGIGRGECPGSAELCTIERLVHVWASFSYTWDVFGRRSREAYYSWSKQAGLRLSIGRAGSSLQSLDCHITVGERQAII